MISYCRNSAGNVQYFPHCNHMFESILNMKQLFLSVYSLFSKNYAVISFLLKEVKYTENQWKYLIHTTFHDI